MRRYFFASLSALGAIGWVNFVSAQAPGVVSSPPGAASQGQVVSTPLPYGAASANNNNNANAFVTPPGSTAAAKVSPPRGGDGVR
jgi:hypothetical protein